MMLGLASFGLSMWSYSFITHDWGADQLLIPQILRGLPQVFAVAPAVNLGLASLPPERLKYASGLFNMMRNLGGARWYRRMRRHPQCQNELPLRRHRFQPDTRERSDDQAPG